MTEQWHKNYIQLAFRLEAFFHQHYQLPFVGYYYGPPEWKQQVMEECIQEPLVLLRAVDALQDTLLEQGFEQHRATYLSKQVSALKLICRQLQGEQFSTVDELRELYDISLTWIPDEQFAAALALYDEALPGTGPLAERLSAWRRSRAIPVEQQDKIPLLVQLCIEEIRSRSRERFNLPVEEQVILEMEAMSGGYSGVCLYQGQYHSHCNLDVSHYLQAQDPVSMLVEDLCHEMYPGHHTSFIQREQHLFRKQGYLEESIWLLYSPNAIIGEGIATHASSMIFTPEELEDWLAHNVYPQLGLHPESADVSKIQRATDMLNDIYGNALLLFREGRADEEIQAYMGKYLRKAPLWIWKEPFCGFVGFTEFYGKQLMHPWLQGPDRQQNFRRFLAEQWYPSQLVK